MTTKPGAGVAGYRSPLGQDRPVPPPAEEPAADPLAPGPPGGDGAPPPVAPWPPLPEWLAIALVVVASASVLILEILAGRLLAPYVGVSLETYTGIIGTVLLGISLGAWAGGVTADRHDPRRLLPLLFIVGGALAFSTIPVVRALGGTSGVGAPGGGTQILLLSALGFLPAATVLSAVPPAVVKLQLRELSNAAGTVGTLSAWSTGGAIVATFLTGFVLVRWAAVTTLIVAVGVILVAIGLGLWAGRRAEPVPVLAALALAGVTGLGAGSVASPCQARTVYYCASVVTDDEHPTRRTLVLDDLRHSVVDLDKPTYLEFWYIRRLAGAIDVAAPAGPLRVVHVGGGGFTLPRLLRATRPGSEQLVLEIDGGLVELVERELGFRAGPDVAIEVGDGRLGVAARPDASADVIIGDAFGSRAVPWHLATREFLADVHRVLRPGGLYVANIIDGPAQRFLRAEAATLAEVFDHVEVIVGPQALRGLRGNSVIVASDRPIDTAAIEAQLRRLDEGGRRVEDLATYLDGAEILTDDFAPVDQLLTATG